MTTLVAINSPKAWIKSPSDVFISLNPIWFFSVAIIYIGAAIFNLIAIYVHGTSYNQIFIFEFILGGWPAILGLTIVLKENNFYSIRTQL